MHFVTKVTPISNINGKHYNRKQYNLLNRLFRLCFMSSYINSLADIYTYIRISFKQPGVCQPITWFKNTNT